MTCPVADNLKSRVKECSLRLLGPQNIIAGASGDGRRRSLPPHMTEHVPLMVSATLGWRNPGGQCVPTWDTNSRSNPSAVLRPCEE